MQQDFRHALDDVLKAPIDMELALGMRGAAHTREPEPANAPHASGKNRKQRRALARAGG